MQTLIQFLFLFISFTAWAGTPAQPETQLTKLSKSLRGVPASPNDLKQLALAIQNKTVEAFFQTKTQDYLADVRFSAKLKRKYDELLRLKTADKIYSYADEASDLQKSTYDSLVGEVISKNLSWDQLLLTKNYQYLVKPSENDFLINISVGENHFFNLVQSNKQPFQSYEEFLLAPTAPTTYRFNFDSKDPRIAGILTTKRFLERYNNTALNKNRRRAAAIFRIFLCDNMVASIPVADEDNQKKDYDTILPDANHGTEDELRNARKVDIHGQQADCMACHYKLDPMGQVFGLSSTVLSPFPSPGGLVFKTADQRSVHVPLKGAADLAENIVKQPEYLSCQVSHFWNWYIGKDVPLSSARKQQLVQKFEQVGRKPKDFISYLVTTDEFRAKPVVLNETQILARRASKILTNCNSCHFHQNENPTVKQWDLADFPYPVKDRSYMIRKVSKSLDIKNNGAKKEMPPEDSVWKLSDDNFVILKTWLEKGAPDFDGVPQVGP